MPVSSDHNNRLHALLGDDMLLIVHFLALEELKLNARADERVRLLLVAHPLLKPNLAVELGLHVLDQELGVAGELECAEIEGDNIMLQLQVILLFFVEAAEDEDLALVLIGAGAHPGR